MPGREEPYSKGSENHMSTHQHSENSLCYCAKIEMTKQDITVSRYLFKKEKKCTIAIYPYEKQVSSQENKKYLW